MVGVSSERKTYFGGTGACRKALSMICRHPMLRVPIIGSWAMSAMLTARRFASGALAGATNDHGVIKQRTDPQRPGVVWADIDEGDVDLASLDGMDQIGAIPGFAQQDLDARPFRTEGAQELRKDLGADAR